MMNRYRRSAFSQYFIIAIILLIIIGFGFLSSRILKLVPFTDDFMIPWAAGRAWLLDGDNPYNPILRTSIEGEISKSGFQAQIPGSTALSTPIINLVFYLPFSLIPYGISRIIWTTMIAISVVVICYISLLITKWKTQFIEKLFVILLFTIWLPGVSTIISGHLSPLIISLIMLGILLLTKGQDTAAGFILSLSIGSLPLSLIIMISLLIWSISHRRWSMIIAYFAGAVFQVIISILLLPSWPMDWLQLIIKTIESGDWLQTPLMTLSSRLPGIETFLLVFLHSITLLYLIVLFITIRKKVELVFIWKLSMILVLSVFVSMQMQLSSLFFVLPGTFLVLRFWSERWHWKGKIASWVFILTIALGSWIILYPDIVFIDRISAPAVFLGVPALVIVGLIGIRWWALEIPRVPDQFSR
jgi:hypothetical protein